MADSNLLLTTDATLNLLSKSSPSQLQPFQLNRSRTQPLVPTEAFYVSSQKTNNNNNNNNLKPSNLSHVPCKFYKQGTCTAGANCTFSHSSDLSSESAVCKYFVKGNCKFGTKCALLHTMSPYGSLQQQQQQGKSNRQQQQQQQQQQQPSQAYSFNSRRKTNDQMMNNSLDHRSFLSDAFGSSAPAVSLFNTTNGGTEQLWRTNPPPPSQQQRTNDFIGLRSSPRETSDHHLLNYNRPSTNTITTHSSSSVRSNNGYFNIPENRRNITNGYNHPHQHQHQHHHHSSSSIDDLNDAMLPSSLNDLFTPTELHARSLRQQESSYEPWRVPFFEGTTAAINIPSGQHTSGSSGNEGSNSSYLQGQPEDDDEVQFFMEDDEAVTYDHMNNTKPTATTSSSSYNFPSLISLPST